MKTLFRLFKILQHELAREELIEQIHNIYRFWFLSVEESNAEKQTELNRLQVSINSKNSQQINTSETGVQIQIGSKNSRQIIT